MTLKWRLPSHALGTRMDKSVGTPQIYLLMGSPLTMMWKVVYRIWTKPTKKLTQEFLHFSLRVSNITLAQNAVGKAVLRGCCILNRFLFQEHRLSFFLLSIQQAFSKQSTHELLSKYPMWHDTLCVMPYSAGQGQLFTDAVSGSDGAQALCREGKPKWKVLPLFLLINHLDLLSFTIIYQPQC